MRWAIITLKKQAARSRLSHKKPKNTFMAQLYRAQIREKEKLSTKRCSLCRNINGAWLAYHKGMKMKRSIIYTTLTIFFGFLFAVGLCFHALSLPVAASQNSGMRIVIDAGHGGIDGGVSGIKTGTRESDLNLTIAFLVKDRLTDMGFSITMTRTTDNGLYGTTAAGFKKRDLEKRRQICEAAKPLCMVSIHQNFFPSSASRGGQVFYAKGNEHGKSLAESVQTELNSLYAEQGVKGRKSASADYYLLSTPVPSLIVECGFLSNPKDEALLISSVFQAKLANAIVCGVLSGLENLSAV